MATYKVLQQFRDKETKVIYEVGQEIEMTVKRADQAIANLKKWDGTFLERVQQDGDGKGGSTTKAEDSTGDKAE
ncbi:hypothetical protein DMN77_08065 [Paenibacillus sp. 79R4]|uniref:hypothetical protein n=1 Tax=Paenibacillus sp. 79R4 TaxID=2212847 RepID=UPI0015BBA045|nr:hypothetical protein [Paenibacillus sp. 79R4]NWL87558.1 hypothetical protein [Paenibacillus sp. 79R4]